MLALVAIGLDACENRVGLLDGIEYTRLE